MALFERIGISQDRPEELGPIMASTSCVWRTKQPGTESRDGIPVARGTAVIVLIDYRSGQKVPVPDEMRAAIAALR